MNHDIRNFWAPDVKASSGTIDLNAPIDIRMEHAMMVAYSKGKKDGEKKLNKEIHEADAIDAEVREVEVPNA